MKNVTRREFIRTTSIIAASTPALTRAEEARTGKIDKRPLPQPTTGPTRLSFLDGRPLKLAQGTAFGVPWKKGEHPAGTAFSLRTCSGMDIPLQTWITATWPDGSIKWSGHAVAPDVPSAEYYIITPGVPKAPKTPVQVTEDKHSIRVDTGIIQCSISRQGTEFITSITRRNGEILKSGRLTGMRQDSPDRGSKVEPFESRIDQAVVEQNGPIRAVVKLTGQHLTESGRKWLPFTIRLYFHAGSDGIRMTHTFIFDGDENVDFISGLGIRFNVPLKDACYNRHVRFAGQNGGLWAESIQGLTGLRRDPGEAVRAAQIAGKAVPDIHTWAETVSTRVHWIPKWGDFSLSQANANGFLIRKRTQPGHAWVRADEGGRSDGLGYIGGASGGVAFGMRDFWKLHPTQLDIRDAEKDQAEVTIWIWSPDSPPMDIRFYHNGFGQDVKGPLPGVQIDGIEASVPDEPYAKQLDALLITYEDYEPGFGTPHGVGRSTDIYLQAVATTPSREQLVELAKEVARPPQLVPRPGDIHRAGVFSNMWNLPNCSTPNLARLEDRLNWSIRFYHDQVEQRHWYGFWDYGDVMHTYDRDRHVWRYDVGGYAWDNSELSSDMWLWYSFLRTGQPMAFRLAEAMNRHNRDVDIYHLGRFAGFGTRHNVQHWGCSAKQLRISTCMNRRFHYFLTTDERTGDVLQEVVEADRMLATLNPTRKLPGQPFKPKDCKISVGTDYGATVSNWLTAWERTGDPKYRQWIEHSMRDIGDAKWGFFTGDFAFDPESKRMTPPADAYPRASHLSIMFGLPEVVAELIELIDVPPFRDAWLRYCRFCNAAPDILRQELGEGYKPPGFKSSHSRITAYAAHALKDKELAKQAASELLVREWPGRQPTLKTDHVEGPDVLNPVDEAQWVSTNETAQWGLAAMQASALIPQAISKFK